ncbi:MAG: hypothetical protein ABI885_07475 [Gammaproteobacteria bacterium]
MIKAVTRSLNAADGVNGAGHGSPTIPTGAASAFALTNNIDATSPKGCVEGDPVRLWLMFFTRDSGFHAFATLASSSLSGPSASSHRLSNSIVGALLAPAAVAVAIGAAAALNEESPVPGLRQPQPEADGVVLAVEPDALAHGRRDFAVCDPVSRAAVPTREQ